MNMHKNARLTPLGRERIVRQVESGQTNARQRYSCLRHLGRRRPEAVAEAAGVCPRTVRKWVGHSRLRLFKPTASMHCLLVLC
jgi:hypothetical protein